MSHKMLAINLKNIEALGIESKVDLVNHDLTRDRIPAGDGSAVLVLNQIVSCYLTAAQRDFCFAEFSRVTKRNGFVLGSGLDPNFSLPVAVQDNQKREGHIDLLQNVVGPLLGEIQHLIKTGEISPASSAEMRQLLQDNNFEVICIGSQGFILGRLYANLYLLKSLYKLRLTP